MAPPGTFRNKHYSRYVVCGKRTIKDGECCAVWDLSGRREVIEGPHLKYLWRSLIQFQDRYFADQQQYLIIRYKSGKKEHLRGPISIFEDPVIHDRIEVRDATHINGYEVIVVYKEVSEDKVQRRVIKGPQLFIPDANEWIHNFSWHGTDPENKTKIKAGINNFQKLQVIPQQMYYNVHDVRTSDDAQVTVKLMLFYEVANIEQLLDTTQDPIADLINSICSDVIQYCSSKTYEQFIQNTNELNYISTYKHVIERANLIGFKVSQVAYRGYQASEQLQKMHDAAIQSRTALSRESETAQQAQELEDMKLARKLERSMKEMQLQRAAKEHQLSLVLLEHEQEMKKLEMAHKEKMRQKEEEQKMEIEALRLKNQEEVDFLTSLKEMDVDVTKYLVSNGQRADKIIRIEGGGNSSILIDPKQ